LFDMRRDSASVIGTDNCIGLPVSDAAFCADSDGQESARLRQQPAHTDITLRLPQQQCTAIGRLIAALEIDGEFLATDGWQFERKRRIVVQGRCGGGLIREATRWNNELLRESAAFRQSRRKIFQRRA
jgi:hypothetical protein